MILRAIFPELPEEMSSTSAFSHTWRETLTTAAISLKLAQHKVEGPMLDLGLKDHVTNEDFRQITRVTIIIERIHTPLKEMSS